MVMRTHTHVYIYTHLYTSGDCSYGNMDSDKNHHRYIKKAIQILTCTYKYIILTYVCMYMYV